MVKQAFGRPYNIYQALTVCRVLSWVKWTMMMPFTGLHLKVLEVQKFRTEAGGLQSIESGEESDLQLSSCVAHTQASSPVS